MEHVYVSQFNMHVLQSRKRQQGCNSISSLPPALCAGRETETKRNKRLPHEKMQATVTVQCSDVIYEQMEI